MKKKWKYSLSILGVLTGAIGGASLCLANPVEVSDAGFDLRSGELRIQAVRDLEFDKITYKAVGQVIHPRIERIHEYDSSFKFPDGDGNYYNRYSPSLIDIEDSRLENKNWQLMVSMGNINVSDSNGNIQASITDAVLTFNNVRNMLGKWEDGINTTVKVKSDTIGVNFYQHTEQESEGVFALGPFDNDSLNLIEEEAFDMGLSPIPTGPYIATGISLFIPPQKNLVEGRYTTTLNWKLVNAL